MFSYFKMAHPPCPLPIKANPPRATTYLTFYTIISLIEKGLPYNNRMLCDNIWNANVRMCSSEMKTIYCSNLNRSLLLDLSASSEDPMGEHLNFASSNSFKDAFINSDETKSHDFRGTKMTFTCIKLLIYPKRF